MENDTAISRKSFIGRAICLLFVGPLFTSLLTACRSNQPEQNGADGQTPDEKNPNTETPNVQNPTDDPTQKSESEYALVMLESKANELGIINISDLANQVAGTMNVSAPEEAYKGDAVLESMQEAYGVYFKNHVVHDAGEGYTVLKDGSGDAEVGVALVTSNDPALQKDDVRILNDDKKFFEK